MANIETEITNEIGKRKILVADDNQKFIDEQFVVFCKETFRSSSLPEPEIISAITPEHATEILNDENSNIDIAVIDYEFPESEENGLSILQKIKDPSVVTFGLSAHQHGVESIEGEDYVAYAKDNLVELIHHMIRIVKKEVKRMQKHLSIIHNDFVQWENSLCQRESFLVNLIESQREPYLALRLKSFWYMLAFLCVWFVWKMTGYVILNPFWAIVGLMVSLIFFGMSYLLKADINRLKKQNLQT